LLTKYGDDCKVICGGQSLLILMRQGLVAPKYMVDIRGFKYSELLALQFKSFGGEGFKALAEVLEKETKVDD